MSKLPKENKEIESDLDEENEEIDYNTQNIVIYDIDNIDKVYKELIESTEKLQEILKKPSISGSPLEVISERSIICNLQNNMKYNNKKKILTINKNETFKGRIIKEKKEEQINKQKVEKTFLSLENGVYEWSTGEKYQGEFNKDNYFHGKGKIEKNEREQKYSLESDFINGYPYKDSKFFLSKKNLYDLYIQSNIIKNENMNSPFKLILSGKTTIVKTQGGKEVYRFDGTIDKEKIDGMASIKKRYKVLRNVEITLNSTKIQNSVLRNLEIEINEPHKNTFYFKGNYIGGLKVGKYTLEDKKEKISVKNKESELRKIVMKLQKILRGSFGGESFEKIYRFNLSGIKLFNRIYKTKIEENNQIVHLSGRELDHEGLVYFTKMELANLKELALNNIGIKDMSPLERANFPLLEYLSLGKNKIVSIDSINKLPFPNLKIILLGYNKITDISPLKQYKSNNLKTLFLIDNSISDLTPLEKLDAPNLEEITLGSKIKDINALVNCKFPKLKQLGLKGNSIKNISSLIKVNFPLLEVLYLNNNQIVDINPLKKANFPNLTKIGLDNNKIRNINPLFYLRSSKLQYLNISHNNFRPTSSENRESIELLRKRIREIYA
jgi:Leucine-rich repeat (LRR) protein